MPSEMAEAIRQLTQDKGISVDSVKMTIENTLKAAYKRKYKKDDNAIIVFADDLSDVSIYSRKTIVDEVEDPVTEIDIKEALKLSPDCEIGDEIDILEDPRKFDRSAVSTGKQAAHQGLNESYKDNLYDQYKDKIGEIIIGYYQRERNGNIYVDLGKVEGILPRKFQSPREEYNKDDRIKAMIVDLKRTSNGLQLVLSRSDPEFVRSIVELEVPEIYDKTVEIHKIVRDAGYRTKIAVSSNREDVDPVGACVGLKGVRIQNVIRELYGEKIDVLKYDPDPTVFIKNALSPAEVSKVVIVDSNTKKALAIVPETQFSLAIGKQGQNVRLANRLCDWTIDVKTEAQAAEMDLSELETVQAARNLFNDNAEDSENEITSVSELPNVDPAVAEILKKNNLDNIERFIDAIDDGSAYKIEGLTPTDVEKVNSIINNVVEFVDANEKEVEPEDQDEEEYFCPECGAKITLDMTHCPQCGVEFEFKEDEE